MQVGKGGGTIGLSESGGCVLPGGTVASASSFPTKTVGFESAFHAVVPTSCTETNIGTRFHTIFTSKFAETNPITVVVKNWINAPFSGGGVIPGPITSIRVNIGANHNVPVALGFKNKRVISTQNQAQASR